MMYIKTVIFSAEGTETFVYLETHKQLKAFLDEHNTVVEMKTEYKDFVDGEVHTGILNVKLYFDSTLTSMTFRMLKTSYDAIHTKVANIVVRNRSDLKVYKNFPQDGTREIKPVGSNAELITIVITGTPRDLERVNREIAFLHNGNLF